MVDAKVAPLGMMAVVKNGQEQMRVIDFYEEINSRTYTTQRPIPKLFEGEAILWLVSDRRPIIVDVAMPKRAYEVPPPWSDEWD